MTYQFDQSLRDYEGVGSRGMLSAALAVHRLNIPDSAKLRGGGRDLVGSRTGIAILDSSSRRILVPPSSSAEVDFWVFADGRCVVTHANPHVARLDDYPSLGEFLESWGIKRAAEVALGVPHGVILANLKTHGQEEWLLKAFEIHGIPLAEVALLDQEYPATDRLLRRFLTEGVAPLLVRVSRIEPLENVNAILRQPRIFARPRGFFYDPIGSEAADYLWPFAREEVEEMYSLAPELICFLCCPSRWEREDQITPIAEKMKASGIRAPIVMTDLELMNEWSGVIKEWG